MTRKNGVGAERGVNCEHMHVLVTNSWQKHWEWKEDRWDAVPGVGRQMTTFMASLEVRTFDVAKPGVPSDVLASVGTRGHVVAALLEEMKDIRRSACLRTARRSLDTPDASGKGVWRLWCCEGRFPSKSFGELRRKGRRDAGASGLVVRTTLNIVSAA